MDLVVNNLINDEICSICWSEVGSLPGAPPFSETNAKIEEITREIFKSPCSHYFHPECIAEWRQTGDDNCPNCRRRLSNEPNRQREHRVVTQHLGQRHLRSVLSVNLQAERARQNRMNEFQQRTEQPRQMSFTGGIEAPDQENNAP